MAYFVKLEKLSGIRLSFRFSALLHFHKTNSFRLSFLSFSLSLFLSLTHTQTHTNLVAISVLKKAKVKVSSILTSTLALVSLYFIALQFIFPSENLFCNFCGRNDNRMKNWNKERMNKEDKERKKETKEKERNFGQ
jgi:hypothetical protein